MKKREKVIYPKNFEDKIGFDKIRQILKDLCLSTLGQKEVDRLVYLIHYDKIDFAIHEVDEFKQICLFEDHFPESFYFDVTTSLNKIKKEGFFLEVNELFDLKRSLESIRGILNFFSNTEDDKYIYLKRLTKNIKSYPFVIDKINSIITSHGRIKDNASPKLSSIRSELRGKQASISKKMQSILNKAQRDGFVDKDTNLSMRDGRMVIPVNSSNKRKIRGIVHDESATGKTSFIEPADIVEVNNEIKELEYEERREIYKILIGFADYIRPYIEELLSSYEFLGTIDFIRAKAKLAIRLGGIMPDLKNEQLVQWRQAKHPILDISLKKENKKIVSLDIQMDSKKRIVLISGPNAGGKSVCLQTVGILQYMLQCGMLVPMDEGSEMGVFDHIFIDIGDEQSIENDLSTYSSHLLNMKFFTKNANNKTLLLIDEFGTGTEPMLGGAIAEAVLMKLNKSGTFGVITTHYTNLKHFASSTDGIENGAMLFDTGRIQPLFQLRLGKPGSSFAFEIARKIGLSEEILEQATQKIGKEHINFDRHLKDLIRDKRYWEGKRTKVRQSEKKLDELILKYSEQLKTIEKTKKNIINKTNQEAENLLDEINKKIENTIREIKESNAEKEKTKKIRKDIEEYKDKVKNSGKDSEEKIDHKINKLKEKEDRIKNKEAAGAKIGAKPEDSSQIEAGDKVRLVGQDSVGEVLEVNPKSILVAFGNIMTTVDFVRLEKISNNEFKKQKKIQSYSSESQGIDIRDRKLNFVPRIDVRGKRADDALQVVTEFIDEAILVGVSEVKILHGKGNGILRQLIRDYLQSIEVVSSVKDETIENGGAGISVIKLNF